MVLLQPGKQDIEFVLLKSAEDIYVRTDEIVRKNNELFYSASRVVLCAPEQLKEQLLLGDFGLPLP
jgi:hypothetical protein